ncbi:hypothetical protein MPSEU_000677800 [Mayamaea pseudoterrestris]|nr:hypothetical protein MPSEU_000677800 [Mayamaea pseudoterrestris]
MLHKQELDNEGDGLWFLAGRKGTPSGWSVGISSSCQLLSGLSQNCRIKCCMFRPMNIVAAASLVLAAFYFNSPYKYLYSREESYQLKSFVPINATQVETSAAAAAAVNDSSTATVMGMATGYDLRIYQQFVGTLRKTGYKGHIILGVSPDVSPEILAYFEYRNVTPKLLQYVNCTYSIPARTGEDATNPHVRERTTCAYPYHDIKVRWSRFPLARDWLRDCDTCTGPVLIMDVRDSYFQRDPFGEGSPPVKGLQVYEEYKTQTTMHWLAKWPIETCKGVVFDKPMLCSGTTTGTREAVIQYLDAMYQEMQAWIMDPKCWFPINGDDQSIHNYLYYSGKLPFATAVPMLTGQSIVNTVGVLGAQSVEHHVKEMSETRNLTRGEALAQPFRGARGDKWCGHLNVCDQDGFFLESDGTRSRVIHQFDRYDRPFLEWMGHNPYFKDPYPLPLHKRR